MSHGYEKIKWPEFQSVTDGHEHQDEDHFSWGVAFTWIIEGVEYLRHQPDLGNSLFWKRNVIP